MSRVKICGLTTESDLETAVDAGADAVGIICDVPVETPREVSLERARTLAAATPPFVTSVLVTMATAPTRTNELVAAIEPDAVQLHGDVSRDELSALRDDLEADLLLAVAADDVAAGENYDDLVDGFVVDSVDDEGGGGTGETHDWDRTREATADLESPIILAGGLTPANVADAVRTAEPFAVDVASGVEYEGGHKDDDAVYAFVERANRASQTTEPTVSS
ncbi:phosphoribosylanthranilate isomerase [Salinadaptatus halalkaliphilus]|uniref:N-(5'-phosphoribosyl)anthranilate isomerase n=1 Tax=Salinadaptatus halalkaliphilus TaxID=2419781 RepID=A0A4V3VLH0_9EURY|nr:phosphoribosylanthranilate isomerase [Salinadaptatus halalkaliphilus]THE65617.1 phosphoribosylanthranilate isomerase [Salinadaptatus halalkaliphilus]